MSKHTPGPWKVAGSCHTKPAGSPGKWHHVAHVSTADDYHHSPYIADIHNRDVYHDSEKKALRPDTEQLANARLIAAAPDLLAACKAVLQHENLHDSPPFTGKAKSTWRDVMELAVAAIAKTEGI